MLEPWIVHPFTGLNTPFSKCPTDVLVYLIQGGLMWTPEPGDLPSFEGISKAIATKIVSGRG